MHTSTAVWPIEEFFISPPITVMLERKQGKSSNGYCILQGASFDAYIGSVVQDIGDDLRWHLKGSSERDFRDAGYTELSRRIVLVLKGV